MSVLPGLAKHVDFLAAHNDCTTGFLVVRKVAHDTVYGYVWETSRG
ncbi:hypothetical protein ACLF6K_06255 [Streptomyces xanthophaeus]